MVLANDVFALHINNRYGFTYGKFGLISLIAFVRVMPFKMVKMYFYINSFLIFILSIIEGPRTIISILKLSAGSSNCFN